MRTGEQRSRIILPVLVGIVFVLGWHGLVTAFEVPRYIVPTPVVVAQTLAEEWPVLLHALMITMKVTLTAFLLAVVCGTATAFVFVQSRWIEHSFFPYAVLLQVTPIVAVAPLIIIWVKDTDLALVLCAAIVAVFPVISNTTIGLRSVDPGLVDLFRMNHATRLQTLLRLRVPSALPYFFGGLRIASGLALIGAVVAEFVAGTGGSGAGLAYQILLAGLQVNTPRLFAALLLITLAGVLLFLTMAWLSRATLGRWHESEMVVQP